MNVCFEKDWCCGYTVHIVHCGDACDAVHCFKPSYLLLLVLSATIRLFYFHFLIRDIILQIHAVFQHVQLLHLNLRLRWCMLPVTSTRSVGPSAPALGPSCPGPRAAALHRDHRLIARLAIVARYCRQCFPHQHRLPNHIVVVAGGVEHALQGPLVHVPEHEEGLSYG